MPGFVRHFLRMDRASVLLLLAAGILFCGCKRNGPEGAGLEAPVPAASGLPDLSSAGASAHGPGALNGLTGHAGRVLDEETLERLRYLVHMAHEESNRFPADLSELVKAGQIESIPPAPKGRRLVYNASNGELKLVDER